MSFPIRCVIRTSAKTGKPAKYRAPDKTVLVEARAPTDEERALNAEQVFVRRDADGNHYLVYAQSGWDRPSQFGAPHWVMAENQEDATRWHLKIKSSRYRSAPPNFQVEILSSRYSSRR